jgi:hypothetical protein
MKIRAALLLAVMAVLFTAAILSVPRSASSAENCTCRGMSDGPTFIGTGDSCTTAQSNLKVQAYEDAKAECTITQSTTVRELAVCSNQLNITTACYFDSASQTYKIGGYMHYGCWLCTQTGCWSCPGS